MENEHPGISRNKRPKLSITLLDFQAFCKVFPNSHDTAKGYGVQAINCWQLAIQSSPAMPFRAIVIIHSAVVIESMPARWMDYLHRPAFLEHVDPPHHDGEGIRQIVVSL